MSLLRRPNNDDHPEAARKHLADARVLLSAKRADGAAYLSGYVVECALKSVYILETGSEIRGHDFRSIGSQVAAVAAVAEAKTAKYFGKSTREIDASALSAWSPDMRYHAPHMSLEDAEKWRDYAEAVFNETIFAMELDGLI